MTSSSPINDFGPITDPESRYKIDRFFQNHKPFNVLFTGGEPLITPGIEKFFRLLVENGHLITVQTNLKKGPDLLIQTVPPEHIAWILASFHSVRLKEFGAFLSDAIELRERGYRLVVKLMLDHVLLPEFPRLFDIFKNNGIGVMLSPIIYYSPNAKVYPPRSYTPEEWSLIVPRVTLLSSWLFFSGGWKSIGSTCYAGSRMFYIWPDGSIHGCCQGFPHGIGNLHEGKLRLLNGPVKCQLEQCVCDLHYYSGVIPVLDESVRFGALLNGEIETVPFTAYLEWLEKAQAEPLVDLRPLLLPEFASRRSEPYKGSNIKRGWNMLKEELKSKRYEPSVIDLNNRNNGHTLTIELTGYNKTVLEVGTSTGYVSKILRERGNKVVGVEIDPEAASIAKQYCDQIIVGDIENLELGKFFEQGSFDVAIFSDVLEHLRWPHIVLEKMKRYLKPNGYLVVSLPNIAHGDILLNLFSGKFEYVEKGLLDVTHLRFFTLEDIIKLFDESGYQVADLQTTTIDVGSTEVNVNLSLVPEEVLEFIKTLPYSNAYQFVFKAYLKEYGYVSDISLPKINLQEAYSKLRDVRIESLDATLNNIYNSHGWKVLLLFYKIRDRLFPPNSKRRLFVKLFLTAAKNPKGLLKNLNKSNIRKFFAQCETLDPSDIESRVRRKLSLYLSNSKHTAKNINFDEGRIFSVIESLVPPREKNRILVIDRFVPTHDKDSGSLRMYSFLKVLNNLDYKITFLPDNLQKTEPYAGEFQRMGVEVLSGGLNVEKYFEKMGSAFTFVILSRPEQAFKYIPLTRANAINSSVIYDTVDLQWVRLERAAAVNGDKKLLNRARYFKSMELFNASCSDVVFTVTRDERELLLKELPALKIEVIPNIHDVIKKESKSFEKRKDIMFIGGFLHEPNEDAVFFFIKEIFPIVKERIPDIRFFIVGSDPSAAILKLDSKDIKVTGYVKDVMPYFENCRVFVSPLRYGAGMKGKIGHSMSYGLPVVTTSVGAEGIGLVDGENALIVDRPDDFADAIVRLYTEENLWNKISTKSIEHIEKNYSEEVISKKIAELFNSLKFHRK